MSHSNRVFVTGLGALTASGATVDEVFASILAGQSGIAEIKQWDLSSWTHRLGGELKAFQPATLLPDRKLLKVISRQDVMGIHAAMQAVEHSALLPFRETLDSVDAFNDATGVYVASPGNKYYQQYDFLPLLAKVGNNMAQFAEHLFEEVHPTWLLRILPNNVLAYTGITYGFKGPNHNITNHAVGGAQALLEAYHAIKSGQIERAVVVAYDVGTEPQALFYYEKLGVISARHLKPFDVAHDGTILAEGAAAIVLESEASAQLRQATCYAEISGGMSASEASGLFSIEAKGEHLTALLRRTLDDQQLSPADIGFVAAHGNGNPLSDSSEAHAIASIFGTQKIPVTAFKWAMGHTLCTSGVLDAVLTIKALQAKCIPGIANLTKRAETCEGIDVVREHRSFEPGPRRALMINRGYASMNACLVINACD